MLRELHIVNLAVLADATVELAPGLNVFTGETGAGKSLIMGAFELLLGLRSGGELGSAMIRNGCTEARVTGSFEVASDGIAKRIAAILDRPISAGEPFVITRRLFASGRSSASVDGAPATAGMLRQMADWLVDIHGQHDQQTLLKPAQQRLLLDAFAQCDTLREEFADAYRQMQTAIQRREELAASHDARQRELELLAFQADEIEAVDPQPGEYETLSGTHTKLSNVGRLAGEVTGLLDAMSEQEDAIADRLRLVMQTARELKELDPSLTAPADQLADASEAIDDAARTLARYLDELDTDDGQLAAVEERLDAINGLIHKYGTVGGDDPLAAVLEKQDAIAARRATLLAEASDLDGADEAVVAAESNVRALGKRLTTRRTKAAGKLAPKIESELAQLGMEQAEFRVQLTTTDDLTDAGPNGLDTVEFLIAANPGQAAAPLRQVASGGEISRVMLAIKSVLVAGDAGCIVVFDEIDANIGGRLGSVLGQKLRALSQPSRQVLCITHLAQLAAYGDHHLHISKTTDGDETHTRVTPVTNDARVEELASMLVGKNITKTTRQQAQDLLTSVEKQL